jgi:hypothetical protein
MNASPNLRDLLAASLEAETPPADPTSTYRAIYEVARDSLRTAYPEESAHRRRLVAQLIAVRAEKRLACL